MKKRLLCPALPKPHLAIPLPDEEAHHAIHVLRLRDQDVVEILDGRGHRGLAKLRTRGGPVRVEWISPDVQGEHPHNASALSFKDHPLPIVLEMSVLKGDAMEWTIEKSVELGLGKLIPVLTAHTVLQIKNKGPSFYQERWQKIADQALKQCGRSSRLLVLPPLSLENLIASSEKNPSTMRLWCDEKSAQVEGNPSKTLLDWLQSNTPSPFSEIKVLIGPEGGWSLLERQLLNQESESHQMQRIDLGPLVLRAETAALFAASLISAHVRRNKPT